MRTLKIALEHRYKRVINEDSHVLPWLVKHAAMTINIARKGEDGRTAYERRKGKRFVKEIPEFGGGIWYLMPEARGISKLGTRWKDGIFLGIREESNELIVSTNEGVISQEARGGQMENGGIR